MIGSSNSSSGRSHGENRSFRLPVLFWFGNISRVWGTVLIVIGGVFVGMDDDFVFAMDTPTCRSIFSF